jgi:hypothetical protein
MDIRAKDTRAGCMSDTIKAALLAYSVIVFIDGLDKTPNNLAELIVKRQNRQVNRKKKGGQNVGQSE